MKLPQLDYCGVKFTVRTGSLIILWLHVIYSLSSFTVHAGGFSMYSSSETVQDAGYLLSFLTNSIALTVSGIGIYGIHKERYSFLAPFLIWDMIDLILHMVFYLITIPSPEYLGIYVLSHLIVLAMAFYLWLVVYSHYRNMRAPLLTDGNIESPPKYESTIQPNYDTNLPKFENTTNESIP